MSPFSPCSASTLCSFISSSIARKVPITRIETRDLQPGPVYRQAREAFWDWAFK